MSFKEVTKKISINNLSYCLENNENKLPTKIYLDKNDKKFIFLDFYNEMSLLKSKIDDKEYVKQWDKAKRKVNPYELVNMTGTNVFRNENIKSSSNIIPLSRSFFKMTEMLISLNIIPKEYLLHSGIIANIAEGPGGFIEAIYKHRQNKNIDDTHYCITLQSKNRNIPGWNQLKRRKFHFLNNNNIHLKTGSLYNTDTITKYAELFENKKAFLVTGDGGFDYSNDFNNQEINSHKIIFSEITTSILIQEKKGSMICKMFDLFTYFSLQMIYLLSLLYKKVYIFKPVTSRPANSEKYIIATGFKGVNKELVDSMLSCIESWDTFKEEQLFIKNLILPDTFIDEMEKINKLFTEYQKMYINKTLDFITGKINIYNQDKYSNNWFKVHNLLNKKSFFNKS
jgi:23S rRNA U2552 (ribose-2'-O)-methylase RlmE/FtsJ